MYNPLALPELCSVVALYLELSDLSQCALVNKSWNSSFTPLLWKTVRVSEHDTAAATTPSSNSTPTVATSEATEHSAAHTTNGTATEPSAETAVDVTTEGTADITINDPTTREDSRRDTSIRVIENSESVTIVSTTTSGATSTTSSSTQKQKHPSAAAILKNAHHIRVLNYAGRLPEEYLLKTHFPQLRRLKIVELKVFISENSNDSNKNSSSTPIASSSSNDYSKEKTPKDTQIADSEIQVDSLKVVEAERSSKSHAGSPKVEVDEGALGQSKIDAWIIHLLGVSPLLEVMIVEEMTDNVQVLRTVRDVSQLRMLIWGNIIDDDCWNVFRQPKQRALNYGSGCLEHVCAYGWEKDSGISARAQPSKSDTFQTIKTLKLCCLTGKRAEFLYQMRLVKMCIYQESLCWYLTKDSNHGVDRSSTRSLTAAEKSIFLSEDFDEMCKPNTWQKKLRKIDLDIPGLGDQELARILGSLTAGTLQHLAIRSDHSFGPMSLHRLRTQDHFLTLQHVTLEDTSFGNQFSTGVTLEILTSCPNLVYFSGSTLFAKRLLCNKEPWVCKQLKVLKIHISFATDSASVMEDEESRRLNHLVFSRLAALSTLETLEICSVEERRGQSSCVDLPSRDLDWRIESGLSQLYDLKQLRKIRVGAGQEMEKVDIVWLLANWPKLETVGGRLHKDESELATFKPMLLERGIGVDI
ncbi:hypothetical protein BGZ46_008122 [Entomortierella lignicola]|nr:hypothetical protein BGZ46_008122 [Entomortierella lignicola]